MSKKKLNKKVWYSSEVDVSGNPILPPLAENPEDLEGLHEGELFLHNSDDYPSIWIRTKNGLIKPLIGGQSNTPSYWEVRELPNGDTYLYTSLPIVTQSGVTMYADGGILNLPSIYDGLPIDNNTIYWEDVDGYRVLKAKGGGGIAESVSWADITGKPEWLLDGKISYSEVEGTPDLSVYALKRSLSEYVTESELTAKGYATASSVTKLRNDFDALVDGDTSTAIDNFNEIIAFLNGVQDNQDLSSIIASIERQIAAKYTKPSGGIPKSDLVQAVQTSLGKADSALQSHQSIYTLTFQSGTFASGSFTANSGNKTINIPTTTSHVSEGSNLYFTNARAVSALGDTLKSYVTLSGSQTVSGEKNFTGGLKVNGSPIVYDAAKKYWKLEGDLLITGGLTMYGSDSSFTPSTIMDAIAVDGTTISKDGGVLRVIGGGSGSISEITKQMVIDALEFTPISSSDIPTSLPNPHSLKFGSKLYDGSASKTILASDLGITWDDILGRPTLLSSFTDDVVAGKYLPLTGGTITPSDGYLKIVRDGNKDTVLNLGQNSNGHTFIEQNNQDGSSASKQMIIQNTTSGPVYILSLTNEVESRLHIYGGSGILSGYANKKFSDGNMRRAGFFASNKSENRGGVAVGVMYNGLSTVYPPDSWSNPTKGVNSVTLHGDIVTRTYQTSYANPYYAWLKYMPESNTLDIRAISDDQSADYSTPIQIGDVQINGKSVIHSGNIGSQALKIDGSNAMTAPLLLEYNSSLTGDRGTYVGTSNIAGGAAFDYASFVSINDGSASSLQLSWYRSLPAPKIAVRISENSKWSAWKTIAFTDSNVASATKLQTARTIWGQSFDGSADVNGILTINSGGYIKAKDGNGYARDILELSSTNTFYLGYGSAGAGGDTYLHGNNTIFRCGTSKTECMRITSSGNVGIGTTSPEAKLHIVGKLMFTDWDNDGTFLRIHNAKKGKAFISIYSAYGSAYVFGQDGSRFLISHNNYGDIFNILNGNVGIGITEPSQKLHVDGNVKVENGNFIGNLTGTATKATTADSATYATSARCLTAQQATTDDFGSYLSTYGANGLSVIVNTSGAAVGNIGVMDSVLNIGSATNRLGRFLFQRHEYSEALYWQSANGTGTGWGAKRTLAFTDSNVASATKLQTARTIWGQSFDGTGDVNGILTINSGGYIKAKDGNGYARDILELSSTNTFYLGYGSASAGGDTYLHGNNIMFKCDTSRTERMRITSSGNVGIGTTNPTSKLHISGTSGDDLPLLMAKSTSNVQWNYAVSFLASNITANNHNVLALGQSHSTYNCGLLYYTHSGNSYTSNRISIGLYGCNDIINVVATKRVGINNTEPNYPLDVNNTSRSQNIVARLNNSEYHAGLNLDAASGYNPFIIFTQASSGVGEIGYSNQFGSLYFGKSGTDVGYLNIKISNGNIGIGTTNPLDKLHVAGNLRLKNNDSYYGNYIYFGDDRYCYIGEVTDDSMTIYASKGIQLMGKVNITSDTTIDGNLLVRGGITMYSAKELKNIVDERGLSLDELRAIKPTRYTWKDGRDNRIHFGGIADDIQQVLPEVVYNANGVLTMDYGNAGFVIASSLIKPVVDHEQRIKVLEKENEELKQEIKRLRA